MPKYLTVLTISVWLGLIASSFLPVSSQVGTALSQVQAGEPDIPAVVDSLYFGVPAGNGDRPWYLALDSARRRLYTLNEGLAHTHQGNTISVIDLEREQIVDLLPLNNMPEPQTYPPSPLDLQLDPYRPRLYALSGDRYGDAPPPSLTVIDTDTMTVVATIPGVQAFAVGPERLYLAFQERLWAVEAESLVEVASQSLDLRQFNSPLRLDVAANRLYVGRGQPWSVEIFTADTLEPVGSAAVAGDLAELVLDAANQRLLIVSGDTSTASLSALDLDGRPLADPAPVALQSYLYSAPPLASTGSTLYLVDSTPDYRYELELIDQADLTVRRRLPLVTRPNDMLIDADTDLLYATYSSPDSYVLLLDPATGESHSIFTALTVTDALADPESDRLYVLDNSGALQIVSLSDYRPIDQVETGQRTTFKTYDSAGQLSLDPGRERLYLSGEPVRMVDTATLEVTSYPDLIGQLTPDPTGDRLYLTPPCNCRSEQCNTLILSANTMTGTQAIFPSQDPFSAPCVVRTDLDEKQQLLYATISNGVPGSNSGNYFAVFDVQVAGLPRPVYTDNQISYGGFALDRAQGRAFVPRYRIGGSWLHRFDALAGRTITPTIELVGAQGRLTYDPTFDRLYAVNDGSLQVFDGDLALLAEITLPGQFEPATFDPAGQRLYLADELGQLLVVATSGGQLELPPPPPSPSADLYYLPKLFVAPDNSYFWVKDGRLYRSQNQGQSWQLLGRGLPGRPVSDIGISPHYQQDQTLLAGLGQYGQRGGLYRSGDGGDTWQPATRGLTDLGIQQIAFSPTFSRDQTIFLTTAEQGLFRSTDSGDSWRPLAHTYTSDFFDRKISHLAVSPAFADDGLAIIAYQTLLRSGDGGQSWTDTGRPPGLVAFSPNFTADGLVLSDGHWRSTDGGLTWQPAAAGLEPAQTTHAIFFSPNFTADQTVYLLLQPEFGSSLRLQRSVDAGQSWQSLSSGLPANFEIAAATILPDGRLYLVDDAGEDLTAAPAQLSWGAPPVDLTRLDLQDLAIAPDGTIYVVNGGAGVFESTDQGRSWREIAFPARSGQYQPARLAVATDGTLFAGLESAVERKSAGVQNWNYLANLPAGFTLTSLAVSPNFERDQMVLAGGNYRQNQLFRSTDGGDTWQMVFDGAAIEGVGDISLLAFSPNFAKDGRAYAWLQDGGLLRSNNGGRSWTLVESDQAGYFAQAMAVSADGQKLYLGATGGYLLVSSDQGQSWTDLQAKIPGNRVWSSAIQLAPDGAIFLGTDIGVYRSLDGGQSWSEANRGLPLDPVQNTPAAVRAFGLAGDRLYVALTAGGVYVSTDRGQSWQSTATAAAPTLPTPTPSPPAPAPTAPPTVSPAACPAQPAYFVDLWLERLAQLGCPTDAHQVTMVEQRFAGGQMFWRSDNSTIYVLPANQAYARFDDTWTDNQPAYTCPDLGPAQTPPTPQRGFGKVWCDYPQVREQLGNAASQEMAAEAVVQEFENGLVFQLKGSETYLLDGRSNDWQRVE